MAGSVAAVAEIFRWDLARLSGVVSAVCSDWHVHVHVTYYLVLNLFQFQVVELLEVPHLLDTCVRNGLYDEALDLSDFVSSIVKRHGLSAFCAERASDGSLTSGARTEPRFILYDLVVECRETLKFMREHLLNQLKGKVRLSVCRRCDVGDCVLGKCCDPKICFFLAPFLCNSYWFVPQWKNLNAL